jgi:hypothetical protein
MEQGVQSAGAPHRRDVILRESLADDRTQGNLDIHVLARLTRQATT